MKLAAIFSDGMILQRDKEIYVFGESDTSEEITIEIDDINVSSVVQPGRWSIRLPAHAAGGPYEMIVRGQNTITIKDILYGEVWLDNGQSNIEFELQNSLGGMEEIEKADYPDIRYFKSIKAPIIDDDFLKEEEKLCWHRCQNRDFLEMSGIAYFFAQKLQKNLGIPVGIIDCYQGGTSISCWLQEQILESAPEGRIYLKDFENLTAGQTEEEYLSQLKTYNKMVETHLRLANEAKKENPEITIEELEKKAGEYPWPPPMGLKSAFRPGGLVETMVKRIAPYSVRGIIYYQGEEDAERNYEECKAASSLDDMSYKGMYHRLLEKLVNQYREMFFDDQLPFALVQLPMYISRKDKDVRKWAYIREAQSRVCEEMDYMTLVSLIDLGEYDNVHPVDKRMPGQRIAKEVLSNVYARKDEGAIHMSIDTFHSFDGGIALDFRDTYGEIVLRENALLDIREERNHQDISEEASGGKEEHIYGFEIAVRDASVKDDTSLIWKVPERIEIDGERILIYEDREIVEVRYGFFDYGKVNVYNARCVPLAPFRLEVMRNGS